MKFRDTRQTNNNHQKEQFIPAIIKSPLQTFLYLYDGPYPVHYFPSIYSRKRDKAKLNRKKLLIVNFYDNFSVFSSTGKE
jgi:hypothetical protein